VIHRRPSVHAVGAAAQVALMLAGTIVFLLILARS